MADKLIERVAHIRIPSHLPEKHKYPYLFALSRWVQGFDKHTLILITGTRWADELRDLTAINSRAQYVVCTERGPFRTNFDNVILHPVYRNTPVYDPLLREIPEGHKSGHSIVICFGATTPVPLSDVTCFVAANGSKFTKSPPTVPLLRSRLYTEGVQHSVIDLYSGVVHQHTPIRMSQLEWSDLEDCFEDCEASDDETGTRPK